MSERALKFFISSTYQDLKRERKLVAQMIEKLGHTPLGMELFPAGRRPQWSVITDCIDQANVVIVLVKGSYGTIYEKGKSYTQCEVEYAIEKNIPFIPLIFPYDDNSKKVVDGEEIKKFATELDRFRTFLENKTAKYFTNEIELLSELVLAVRDVERHPLKWGVSDKSSALKKLLDTSDWVVDGEDIYYEPNSDFAIILENEQIPTSNWQGQWKTFQADTLLKKDFWKEIVVKNKLGVELDFKYFDVKLIRHVRCLKRLRVVRFDIKFPIPSEKDGIYFLPAHEEFRKFLKNKGICKNTKGDKVKDILKKTPEYNLCRILYKNSSFENCNPLGNDFILDYLDVPFVKCVLGLADKRNNFLFSTK